jgi:transposase
MDPRLEESEKQLEKRLKKLGKEGFECTADALKAASTLRQRAALPRADAAPPEYTLG